MRRTIQNIAGSGILFLFIATIVLSCTEQPARTNPYDPGQSSPPYTIIGKIYNEGDLPNISSFSLQLHLEKLGTESPVVTPDTFNNTEIIRNTTIDTLHINWVNTESPIELSTDDTLLTVEWEVDEGLEGNGISIEDFMLVDSETGEAIDEINLGSKVRVE